MRVAKVIATCFKQKKKIENTYLVGDPVGYFGHSQNCMNTSDVINLLEFNIEREKNCNPGLDRDLIIVNSDVGSDKGNKFINDLSGTKIPGGKINCITRKNIGRSFGSYNDAFLNYRKNYEYFLFTEDDINISQNNYFKIGLDIFQNEKNCGFVAYIGITKIGRWHWKDLGLNKKTAYSCHGGTGLSSTKILNEVVNKYGHLPHYKGAEKLKDITFGEVAFPNSIIQLGYKLFDLPKDTILAIPAYDLIRNIEYKKWPTFQKKCIFIFKSKIYNIFSKTEFTLNIYLRILKAFKRAIN
tara:strand:+ start:1236 stop:2129 length:894 start_codon:yes stop_codon:yes gene_type:complete